MGNARLTMGKVFIDVLSFAEAMVALERLVASREGGYVVTPNVDHIVLAEDNPEFAAVYQRAALSFADGAPVVWASRLLEARLPERVSGADLVAPVLERAGQLGWRVALVGAGPGVAEQAAQVARERWGTQVVFTAAPHVRLDDAAVIDGLAGQLAEAKPDVVFLAFGAPKQELLSARIVDRVKPAVLLNIGAGLDFLTGNVKRAPVPLRKAGLEWAWRLGQEPRRLWRRYLVNDPRFLLILGRDLRNRRR